MKEEINKCIEVLSSGGLILYPTDTVWGIGCDATNENAVAKIYALKQGQMLKFSVFHRIKMYYIGLIECFDYI